MDDLDDELPALEENNGQEIQEEATVAVDSGGLVTATTQNAATAWIYDYVQVEGDAHPDGTIMLDPVDMRVMYGEYVNDMVDARDLPQDSLHFPTDIYPSLHHILSPPLSPLWFVVHGERRR